MNFRILVFAAGLVATTFATGAATPAAAAEAKAASPYPMDCTRWKEKARCMELNGKIAACKEKTDDAWLQCMYPDERSANFTPPKPRDCSAASNRGLCEAYSAALEACRDKHTRAEHRDCMAGRLQTASFKDREPARAR